MKYFYKIEESIDIIIAMSAMRIICILDLHERENKVIMFLPPPTVDNIWGVNGPHATCTVISDAICVSMPEKSIGSIITTRVSSRRRPRAIAVTGRVCCESDGVYWVFNLYAYNIYIRTHDDRWENAVDRNNIVPSSSIVVYVYVNTILYIYYVRVQYTVC